MSTPQPWRFREPCWSIRDLLGWLIDRDPGLFGRMVDRDELETATCYSNNAEKDDNPALCLLHAFQEGWLAALVNGEELPTEYWSGRTTDDILDDVLMRVRRSDVLVLWADKSTKGADWLPLLGALAHAEAADEFIAKTKICDLMATRKNRVRVTTDTGEIFTDVKLHVPEDLRPEDIDWPNSRPLRPWFVGPGVCRKRARDERRGPARQINLVELNVDHLRARELRQVVKRWEAERQAAEAGYGARLDRPFRERGIFGLVDEIAPVIAR
jgi:hypothetical protein